MHPRGREAKLLLIEIVSRRAPGALRKAHQVGAGALSDENREMLREIVVDELIESGLGADNEPNARGHLLEAIIDWLGRE